jgi:hypothetical protein
MLICYIGIYGSLSTGISLQYGMRTGDIHVMESSFSERAVFNVIYWELHLLYLL